MAGLARLALMALLAVASAKEITRDDATRIFYRNIRMPNATSDKEDDLVCHSMKLDPERHQYIVKYEPHASKATVHHMMLYGCVVPGSTEAMWKCGGPEQGELSVCGSNSASSRSDPREQGIVYAWALDAPPTQLPEGVGLRVGGDTDTQYIVMQLHYSKKFEGGQTDASGVTLHMTYDKLPYQAGFYILGSGGYIPPKTENFHMESACRYSSDQEIFPVRYRTHSHNLGMVTSGYRIRENVWTEIGRMSPKEPQMFYSVTNPDVSIRKGDILAARCTMTNNRAEQTNIGTRNKDEMCNFYIMYYTNQEPNLNDIFCFADAQEFHWKKYLQNIPADASSLEGIRKLGSTNSTITHEHGGF